MTIRYSITLKDTETPPSWLGMCSKVEPPACQDSGRYVQVVEAGPQLEAKLDADDDVIEYLTLDLPLPTKTWTYEGYWNAVLGDKRSAAQVVAEFDLVADRHGLDEWLGHAEDAACSAGGLDPFGTEVEQWDPFHARALDELLAAANETSDAG